MLRRPHRLHLWGVIVVWVCQQSAAQGRPAAQYNVGCAYFMGKGTDRDVVKAAQFFTQAAEAGFFPAMVPSASVIWLLTHDAVQEGGWQFARLPQCSRCVVEHWTRSHVP